MKNKIIIFIIGLLVGASSVSGVFFIYHKTKTDNCTSIEQKLKDSSHHKRYKESLDIPNNKEKGKSNESDIDENN